MLISTQIRLQTGPTFVGDGDSDKYLMERLQARPSQQLGNEFVASCMEYITPLSPRLVLDLLEKEGWKVVQTSTLVKIAAGTFLVGSTGLYLAQKSVQRRVRNLPHYSEGLRIVGEHNQAREALGPPIQVGSVDLADRRHNYVGKTTSKLRIPVTGTVACGFMDVMAVRDDETSPFVTAKIRLVLDEDAVSIYDTGKWKEVDPAHV
ncbi:putative GTP cyclohydrolase I feedback regulatory protein [Necator americanus]|uniref:GTP cyclohydrolase 1 feedback regulatory protein n=1 Tax=Necator americanus TaxID=51031 RepID=W2TBT8_NECAM|nr:putative GTP cyclohydrolase I feedback regulatory protein [Necator americanus]ETN79515.1 putative GTP cyclohydrolase I feedback regulatory protein [Necator americanus]